MKMHILDVLAKYENLTKGGSGYTFQINVDDYNRLLEEYIQLEQQIKGHKKFVKLAIDLDKRADALIKEQADTIRLLEKTAENLSDRNDNLEAENIEQAEKYAQLEKELSLQKELSEYDSDIEKQQLEKIEQLESVISIGLKCMQEQEKELIEKDEKIEELEKEIVEHCETKGLAGRQVFTLTKLSDQQREEIESLKQYKKVLMENSIVRSERIEELERLLEKERNMVDYLVKHHLSGDVYTFERFVEHGRLYAMDKSKEDGHMVNGVPWSFKLNGNAVTHENDECYLVQTKIGFEKFTPKDLLVINAKGQLSVIPFSQSEK